MSVLGARLIPGAVDNALLDTARRWAGDRDLAVAPEYVGQVRQRARMSVERAHSTAWAELADLVVAVRAVVGDRRWRPNEATVMHYDADRGGISPHRDHRRFAYAVAVLSLTGEAQFAVYDESRTQRLLSWICRPGDMVVLRGLDPGDAGAPEARPIHAISNPEAGGRSSLTFRMDAHV